MSKADEAFYRKSVKMFQQGSAQASPPDAKTKSKQRVHEFLTKLKEGGVTHMNLAVRLGVQVQYISDVKHGRRAVSELFARRLQDQCGVNYLWLLGRSDNKTPEGT